jgi:hypothetical protein
MGVMVGGGRVYTYTCVHYSSSKGLREKLPVWALKNYLSAAITCHGELPVCGLWEGLSVAAALAQTCQKPFAEVWSTWCGGATPALAASMQ